MEVLTDQLQLSSITKDALENGKHVESPLQGLGLAVDLVRFKTKDTYDILLEVSSMGHTRPAMMCWTSMYLHSNPMRGQ